MKPLLKDFVIIGSGPAGLNAAITAANLGAQVTIIDENPQIGGQIFRQNPPEISRIKHLDKQSEDTFEKLNQKIKHSNIKIYSSSTVWGIFEKEETQAQNNSEINSKIIATDNREIPLIEARNLLIASGTYEMPVIFPGWTLPGVMTLGSIQILLKSQGVIPEGRVVITGTGPFLYLSASQLIENGANVIGIVEASSMFDWYTWGMQLLRFPSIMLKGIKCLRKIKKAGIHIYFGHMVVEAKGKDKIREVTIAQVDSQWSPKSPKKKTLQTDLLGVNFGFMPSSYLTHLSGCKHNFDLEQFCWISQFNDVYKTSEKNVFVAGDNTGIGGDKMASIEGKIVGIEVSRLLGKLAKEKANLIHKPLLKKLKSYNWYKNHLNKIYKFKPGFFNILTDETTICRCEEVDYKSIKEILEDPSSRNLKSLKNILRTGMGRCQGRFCYPTIMKILSRYLSTKELQQDDFTVRVPLKPLPLKKFIEVSQ